MDFSLSDTSLRGSHGLSARGARRTKSSKPKGPPIRSQGPTIPQTSSQSIMREDVVFSTVYIIHCAHTYILVHWIVGVVVVCSKLYILQCTLLHRIVVVVVVVCSKCIIHYTFCCVIIHTLLYIIHCAHCVVVVVVCSKWRERI